MLHRSQPINIRLKYWLGSKKISLYPKSRAWLRDISGVEADICIHPWQIRWAKSPNASDPQKPNPKPKGQIAMLLQDKQVSMWVRLTEIRRCEGRAGFGLGGLLELTKVSLGRRDALCPGQVIPVCLQH